MRESESDIVAAGGGRYELNTLLLLVLNVGTISGIRILTSDLLIWPIRI